MKRLFVAALLLFATATPLVAHANDSNQAAAGDANANPITVTVLDVMNMSKEDFISHGMGTATAFSAQRSAIEEGSSYLLTAVISGNANKLPSTAAPAPSSASAAGGSSAWRRIGQYIGGASEAEEEEFFAETDRIFERWMEAQQARKIREAIEKRKQAELEMKRQKNKDSKNGESRAGTSEASPKNNDDDPNSSNNKNENQKGQNGNNDNKSKLPLALPASTITANDAKRRKHILNNDVTVEQKIKTLAHDVKSVMKRLRSAFIPAASDQYKTAITGKSAANAARHKQLIFNQFYDGGLPEGVVMNASTGQVDLSHPKSAEIVDSLANRVVYDMLKYYSETTTSASSSSNKANNASSSSSGNFVSSSFLNPYSNFPRLYRLPIIDVDELASLSDELRGLKASEQALERIFTQIEKGSYESDLKLKLESLKNKEKASASHDGNSESSAGKKKQETSSAAIAQIESNPRDYYRALRQHTMTPKVTNELTTLADLLNTNYHYQSQLMHSGYPVVVSLLLPRLRKSQIQLKERMRANDESTEKLRKQLKDHNQMLKLISNDIGALNGIANRMIKFRNNNNIDMLGYGSSTSSRLLLLSASEVTTLIHWLAVERRTGAASPALVHPDDYARIMRGDQPLLADGADESSASSDDSDNSASSRRKNRRKNRGKGGNADSDNYLEGDVGVDFAHRPVQEWANVVSFQLFGLSVNELMTLVIAVCFLPLLVDAFVELPTILVRHTIWLSVSVTPKLRRWAHGNRLAGPSSTGKILLFLVQLHLFIVSLTTNLYVKFGRFALPAIGIYNCDFMEQYLQAGLQYLRQTFSFMYAVTRNGALDGNGSVQPIYQSFAEVQMTFRQRVPFTVFVLTTPSQTMSLAAFLLFLFAVVTITMVAPVYKRAQKNLNKFLEAGRFTSVAKKAN